MVRRVVLHVVAFIRPTPKEAYNPECLIPIVKLGGRSVMVWAAIYYIY
jgi:hypothetical protein